MFPLSRVSSGGDLLMITDGNGFGSSGSIPEPVVKLVCAYCEGSLRNPAPNPSGDHKVLEDIAADHFKRRVLNAEEVSLSDVGSIAEDVNRCAQLLNSVVLCDNCIFQFCSSEAKVLKEQLDYLHKMTGPRDFGDVLADPWLDLKRFAYAKLKHRQVSISEKLSLIQQNVPAQKESGVNSSNSNSARNETPEMNREPEMAPITNGSTGSTAATTTAQTISDSLNCPLPLRPTDPITIINASTDLVPPICQYAVASSGASTSSGPASPNDHLKELENCTSDQSDKTAILPPPEDKGPKLKPTIKIATKSKQAKPAVTLARVYAESAREADSDSSLDDTSSIKSVPTNPVARKTRAKKSLSKLEAPTPKRAKLDIADIFTNENVKVESRKVGTPKVATSKVGTLKVATPKVGTLKVATPKVATPQVATPKVATPKVDAPEVVYAKKSAPSPTSPRSKGKPAASAAANTPESNPMNKPSRKSQNTENVINGVDNVENDKTSADADIHSSSSKVCTPPPPKSKSQSPNKQLVKMGGRTFTEPESDSNSNSSSSDSDGSD